MRLHAIAGFSTVLLLKAMKAQKYSEVVIYTSKKDELNRTLSKVGGLPPLAFIEIPHLDDFHSTEDYAANFRLRLALLKDVDEDDILFYSGTPLAVSFLFMARNFKSYMSYNSADEVFVCQGVINDVIRDRFLPSLHELLRIHGLKHKGAPINELRTIGSPRKQPIIQFEDIKIVGSIIEITMARPHTSGMRKKAMHQIFNLRSIIGAHSMKIIVEDPILSEWVNGIYTPWAGEEE